MLLGHFVIGAVNKILKISKKIRSIRNKFHWVKYVLSCADLA